MVIFIFFKKKYLYFGLKIDAQGTNKNGRNESTQNFILNKMVMSDLMCVFLLNDWFLSFCGHFVFILF